LGALSREYGPALSVCGFAVLASSRQTRRYVFLFCVVAVLCAAPWYVRNWLRTGNPTYAMDPTGLGFPVNAVHEKLHMAYGDLFGLQTFTAGKWLHLAIEALWGAPLALVFGIPGIVLAKKQGVAFMLAALVATGIWIWSIPYTVGGADYSMRVLTPAWVALSVAAGAWGPVLDRLLALPSLFRRIALGLALVGCGGYAVLYCVTFPFGPKQLRTAVFSTREFPAAQLGNLLDTARILDKSKLPPEGVLTDDCYLAIALQRYSCFRPVMAWSPEVAYVLDKSLDPAEVRRRLREGGICYVSLVQAQESYWNQYPLYAIDRANWLVVNGTVPMQPVYFLPPVGN
jgi:hypothetical protein